VTFGGGLFERAQHGADALEIEACPLNVADGIDFVRLQSGRIYMRAISGGQIIVSYPMASHIQLRQMAANILDVADRIELQDRPTSRRRKGWPRD
jgi:hypothetical protein